MHALIRKTIPVALLLGLTLAAHAADAPHEVPLPTLGTTYQRQRPIFHSAVIAREDGDAILAALDGGRGTAPLTGLDRPASEYICVLYPGPYHCLTIQQPNKAPYELSFSFNGGLVFLPDDMRQLTPEALAKIRPILGKLEDDVKKEITAAPRPFTYVVSTINDGGTLSDISRLFFNSPARWKDIYNANRAVIKDPNVIRPGMKLVIPK